MIKAEQARAYETMKGKFEGLLTRLQVMAWPAILICRRTSTNLLQQYARAMGTILAAACRLCVNCEWIHSSGARSDLLVNQSSDSRVYLYYASHT